MIIGTSYRVDGDVIKDDDQYRLIDNRTLKNLVVSRTILKKRRSTNGHSHDGVEEVYIFTHGQGTIQVGKELIPVQEGDIVAIPDGAFHKVASATHCELEFIAIFQSYQRPTS